ncbi:MAG: hypothetical protein KAI24_08410 [Planctomycetes bacterium]|nr:hypothetical protein [Planctomycetota bacterium]
MSLNGRIALVAVVALLVSPLWLPLLPAGILWWRHMRTQAQARGLRVLNMLQARAIVAHAEASLPTPPAGGWFEVARNVDRYLASVDSPRSWRSRAVLVALEFAPCLRLRRPLSRMPLDARRAFLERHLTTTRGLLAIPALARQLIRMGYYTDAGVAADLGFRTMAARRSAPAAAPADAPADASTPATAKPGGDAAGKAAG